MGVAGFAVTRNGFAFLAFLILYIPTSLVVSIMGVVYAIRAYAGLPRGHWGRLVLNVLMVLALCSLALACLITMIFSSHPAGGF
jgi:hypothetical protein